MSIRFIRILQRTSQILWLVVVGVVTGALLSDHLELVLLALPFLLGAVALLLFLMRIRCPVCQNHFAGRHNKYPYSPFCQHCGRHPGDWA